MKKSELISVLREYLNEDLRKIVKQELTNLLLGDETPRIQEVRKPEVRKPIERKGPIFKTKNPLMDVLNETAQAHEPIIDDTDDYREMSFTSVDSPTFAPVAKTQSAPNGNQGLREALLQKMGIEMPTMNSGGSKSAPVSVQEMLPDDRKHVVVNEEVTDLMSKVLTKDYSALVKHVYGKKG